VELPSQFMENFCYDFDILQNLSEHVQTKEKLPKAEFDKIIESRYFGTGMQMCRQVEFSLFDLRLYSKTNTDLPTSIDTVYDILNQTRHEVAVTYPPEYNRFANSFSHIFAGGYAAGYYSYKWAEVLSSDAFSKFEDTGIQNPKTGQEFLQKILEKGGSQDPMDLFIAFMGREPNVEALLRHNGISPE
jgi:oligopeptidase A